MADGFEIDLDGEQVLFDGTWYSKEELARRIKAMVDGGDYRVARPSAALESLQNALSNLRTLSVRLPAELAEALAAAAARQSEPVGAFVREALMRSLPAGPRVAVAAAAVSTTTSPMMQSASLQSPGQSPMQSPGVPSSIPMLAPMVEPATPDEAASAIPLTPKRRDDGEEKGWFGRK